MEFFAEFTAWLNSVLANYIGDNLARMAAALEPFIVTLATLYVMVWGFLQLTGQIREPLLDGLKRIAVVGAVLGVSLHLWLYNTVIVDTFFTAPTQLGAALIGAYEPVAIVDDILAQGADVASMLLEKGGVFDGNFSFYLAGAVVYAIVIITTVYAMFLLSLSRVALSILLPLGPLFIGLMFFATTRRFFEAWCAQLANYALIALLTILVAALMLNVLTAATERAIGTGGAIQIADGARVCVAAGLTFLVFRQIMSIAAGLASGIALSTYGMVSGAMNWAFGTSRRSTGDFLRGALLDRPDRGRAPLSSGSSFSRRAGYHVGSRVRAGASRVREAWRTNSIRR